jgi:hypothetical protein
MKQQQQRFWNVDLIELFRVWIADMGTFLLTALTFVGLAIPVIIPTLILWYLYSIDYNVRP